MGGIGIRVLGSYRVERLKGASGLELVKGLWVKGSAFGLSLCVRTDPEVGKFTAAHSRVSQMDMKHWRHRKARDGP